MKTGVRIIGSVALFFALFIGGTIGGYVLLTSGVFEKKSANKVEYTAQGTEYSYVKIYYPYGGRLQMEERRLRKEVTRQNIAEATVAEYLRGPAGVKDSYVPDEVEVLGLYFGNDNILYIDLSERFSRGFQGDALAEFLLIRGLYESVLSNVYGVSRLKVLIEGKEVESIGGHISIAKPLGEVMSQVITGEKNND
jgi:hypothetical protein